MIEINNLSKTFKTEKANVEALKNISLTISDGDIFGIIGMSGAGKSTLVRCINLLERPTSGEVIVDGKNLTSLTPKELRNARHDISMIFQSFNLLMQRNCLKNICFPLELEGVGKKDAEKKALELLEIVGLKDKAYAYPAQLSGGQQQRIAIARALATEPKVLLCDEATSALDPNTTNSLLDLIKEINERLGITVIVITHQMSVVEKICNHVAILDNGEIAEQGEVTEIFSNPKSEAAKKLVYPEGLDFNSLVSGSNDHFVRLVFNGSEATGKPLISRLAIERGIEANIIYASTRSIEGKAYGSMIISFPKDEKDLDDILKYISSSGDVVAEEVVANV